MLYRYIVFDVDGTLINTEQAIITSLQRVLREELGRDYQLAELGFVLGIPGAVALSQLGIAEIARVNAKWNDYLDEARHLVSLFPGVAETVATLLSLGAVTGIVTSKTAAELRNDFGPFGLLDRFAHVVCADDTMRHKPDPDPIRKFLADAGAEPAQALYVGDTIYDSRCAGSAGVKFALAAWGARAPGVPCDHLLDSPADLLGLCAR